MLQKLLSYSGCLLLAACITPTVDPPSAAEQLERINEALLTSDSATATLEAWCASKGLAEPPVIVARNVDSLDRPASPEQRARLELEPDEPVKYRHVQLVCGETILSVAENWYVPGRLTAAMNAALETTRTPYGKVIRDLGPQRSSLGVARSNWLAASISGGTVADPPRCNETAFSHAAIVADRNGRPLAEVRENYKMALACQQPGG